MNKKKILIVNNNMHIGGVQRALVNLLKCTHEQYDITLMLFCAEGALMREIPEGVRIIPVRSAYRFLGMTKYDVRSNPAAKLYRSFFAALCRLAGRDAAISLMALSQKRISGYDAAISYMHDAGDKVFYGGCNDFVLRHIDAPCKIAFLHCDFLKCGADTKKNKKKYAQFDRIAACSEGCRRAFLNAMPDLKSRTEVVCNCQDYDFIRRSAEQDNILILMPQERINILTVARLGREKGIPRAIRAIAKLKDMKQPYHYYIVGDGNERDEVETLIAQLGVSENVSVLGEKSNPYGYMKAADMLLIPSFSEAAPMVIAEAASLGIPILSTKTTSAEDMVSDTGFGWVCENSEEGICKALRSLLEDADLIKEKADHLTQMRFDNRCAVEQFRRLVGTEEAQA